MLERRPDFFLLEEGIHSRKRTGHGLSLPGDESSPRSRQNTARLRPMQLRESIPPRERRQTKHHHSSSESGKREACFVFSAPRFPHPVISAVGQFGRAAHFRAAHAASLRAEQGGAAGHHAPNGLLRSPSLAACAAPTGKLTHSRYFASSNRTPSRLERGELLGLRIGGERVAGQP